jgi:hypothetical protein
VATSPIHNRVSRFTAASDTAVPGSEAIILELDNRECPKSVAVSETPATPELELAARLDWRKAKQINSSTSAVRNGTGQDTLGLAS